MTPPLFLVATLSEADEFSLDGAEGRHAARVKRLGVGEDVLVGDGCGGLLTCRVASVRGDALTLTVAARHTVARPDPRIVVVQALPKGERAEVAVELLTELGVDEVVPWAASRSIAQWRGSRAERAVDKWRRRAAEASKQSRRAWVPDVSGLASTSEVAVRIARHSTLVLHESASKPLSAAELPDHGDVVVVVGPEGGIAPEELDQFEAVGAIPVRLGSAVLRTSTAGAAALAALSVSLGRWT